MFLPSLLFGFICLQAVSSTSPTMRPRPYTVAPPDPNSQFPGFEITLQCGVDQTSYSSNLQLVCYETRFPQTEPVPTIYHLALTSSSSQGSLGALFNYKGVTSGPYQNNFGPIPYPSGANVNYNQNELLSGQQFQGANSQQVLQQNYNTNVVPSSPNLESIGSNAISQHGSSFPYFVGQNSVGSSQQASSFYGNGSPVSSSNALFGQQSGGQRIQSGNTGQQGFGSGQRTQSSSFEFSQSGQSYRPVSSSSSSQQSSSGSSQYTSSGFASGSESQGSSRIGIPQFGQKKKSITIEK